MFSFGSHHLLLQSAVEVFDRHQHVGLSDLESVAVTHTTHFEYIVDNVIH